MCSIRELIVKRIQHYGWLDYRFNQLIGKRKFVVEEYVAFLNDLSDEDLLETYKRVSESEENLD